MPAVGVNRHIVLIRVLTHEKLEFPVMIRAEALGGSAIFPTRRFEGSVRHDGVTSKPHTRVVRSAQLMPTGSNLCHLSHQDT